MSDDNKQPINPNTDNNLNLDFDINLKPIEEPKSTKIETNLDLQTNSNIPTDKTNLDFDINLTAKPKEQDIAPQSRVSAPEIQQPIQEVIAPVTDIQTPIPAVEQPIDNIILDQTKVEYNADLKAVNDTIQQLQEAREQWIQKIPSNKLDEIVTTQTMDAKIAQQETKNINAVPMWAINLDEILPTPEITTQSPIQDTPQVQFPQSIQQSQNPYDMAPQVKPQTNSKEHKKHLIMVVWIVAVCLIAWFFILKTMYPIQFGANDWWSWNNTDTTTQDPSPFQDTPPPPTEELILTWETLVDTWADQVINEITWSLENLSWDITDHNITDQADPFQVLDTLQTTDEQKKQATIDSLKDFASKWQYYLDLWKQKKMSDMMKFWTLLKGKSTSFINQIESWEILDISSLDSYLAQASWYLQNLQELENAANTAPQWQDTQEASSGFTEGQTWAQTN